MIRRKTSELRKLSIYGFQVTENSHNFYALLEFDITKVRNTLREKRTKGNGGSLFAFFLKAIAECLKLYPDFNSMIDIKKTTTFDEVDISVPIEMMKGQKIYNKQLVIRNVDKKRIEEIDREIVESKKNDDKSKTYLPSRGIQKLLVSLPNFLIKPFFNLLMSKHKWIKELSGTSFVTSVSMFSNVPGFVVPYIGKPKAASFAIGSVYKKPVVRKDEIVIREIVNITAVFNHDMIDGAPAARFINKLRTLIEVEFESLMEDWHPNTETSSGAM